MTHAPFLTITVKEIAKQTGYSVRTIQRRAAEGIPGVTRLADGYHNSYELTDELEDWMKQMRLRTKGRQKENQVIEKNDKGTENFHPFINKIVMLHGKFERDGVFARKSPDQLFGIHRDFMPVIRIWSRLLDSLKSGLSPELQGELKRDFRELGFV